MNSKEAIELIKSDVAHLVKTITQQDKMIKLLINHNPTCMHGHLRNNDCMEDYCSDCWRKYLQGEVSK